MELQEPTHKPTTFTSLSSEGELDGVSTHTTEGIYDQLRVCEAVCPECNVLSDPLWCHREPAL